MGKHIGITYDLKTDWKVKEGDPVDINAEFDAPETVDFIVKAVESCGHRVKRLGNAHDLLKRLNDLDVDIVLNICEGYHGRNRESQVPILLEMHGIPYIGADALTLGVTLDKVLTKKLFVAEGIPTPKFYNAHTPDDLDHVQDLPFPLIVKCRYEGTSKGLTEQSRVTDMASLKRQVAMINEQYDQSAIVEEFIRGTEFTVPVLGNRDPVAMPVIQVSIDGKLDLGENFYTYQMVVDPDTVRYLCPAKVSDHLQTTMQQLAIKVYQCVDCRDFGRVDFRIDEQGNPYVLEINPLPSLAKEDVFNLFPEVLGSSFERILDQILEFGLERNGLSNGHDPALWNDILKKDKVYSRRKS